MDDWGFVNARVRALRAGLLDAHTRESLVAAEDAGAVREILAHTTYGRTFAEPADAAPRRAAEHLRAEWAETVGRLRRIAADGSPREALELLLGLSEVENLKAVLRGKRAGASQEGILAALLPALPLDEAALAELARRPTVAEVVQVLATWRSPHARPLQEALRGRPEAPPWEEMEFALLHRWFADAAVRAEESAVLRYWLGGAADRMNLLAALRWAGHGGLPRTQVEHWFLPGHGRFSREQAADVAVARDLAAAAQVLRESPYAEHADAVERSDGGVPALLRVERALDRRWLRRLRGLGAVDPLGPGLLAWYVAAKRAEIVDLRVLLLAKSYGMYPEDVRTLVGG